MTMKPRTSHSFLLAFGTLFLFFSPLRTALPSAPPSPQVLEAAPPQWAKVADDVQRREYLACVQGPDACPKAEDIHALSTRCVGLAMDSMNNTSADWALVLSVINAHSVAIFETHGPFRGPGPASGVPLQALAARLRGALGPPPTPAPPRPWHRVSLADTNNDMFSIQYGAWDGVQRGAGYSPFQSRGRGGRGGAGLELVSGQRRRVHTLKGGL